MINHLVHLAKSYNEQLQATDHLFKGTNFIPITKDTADIPKSPQVMLLTQILHTINKQLLIRLSKLFHTINTNATHTEKTECEINLLP